MDAVKDCLCGWSWGNRYAVMQPGFVTLYIPERTQRSTGEVLPPRAYSEAGGHADWEGVPQPCSAEEGHAKAAEAVGLTEARVT